MLFLVKMKMAYDIVGSVNEVEGCKSDSNVACSCGLEFVNK